MITKKTLAAKCQDRGLELHQNLTVNRVKIYSVSVIGTKRILKAGRLAQVAEYVATYTPAIPNICRIASLKGFRDVLLGRDMAGIFTEGRVYSVVSLMGQIILTDLGEHASDTWLEGNRINAYATSGLHCLTKAEYAAEVKARDEL